MVRLQLTGQATSLRITCIGTSSLNQQLCTGTCPGLEGGRQIVKWLASGGIDVGLLFTAAQNAPLWAFNHSLVDWPFIVCDLVASGRLLPHTLRQAFTAGLLKLRPSNALA